MTMNKIITALLITVLAFVITILVYNFLGIHVQDTLISMFFMFITAELATMGGIKITNTVKNGYNGNNQHKEENHEREVG